MKGQVKTAKQVLDDTYLDGWTFATIRREAESRISKAEHHSEIWWQFKLLLEDIATVEVKTIDMPDPKRAADKALAVGMRWMAICSKLEWPHGRKTEFPEWEFIRLAYRAARRKKARIYRKEIVDDGLKRFQKSTGAASTRDVVAFLPHFKERMQISR